MATMVAYTTTVAYKTTGFTYYAKAVAEPTINTGYNVTAIGMTKAARIAYRMLSSLSNPTIATTAMLAQQPYKPPLIYTAQVAPN
jgi:hypothetical protein